MIANLQKIWALVVKELLALVKDKRSRMVLIVPPLVQLMVFGYAATFDLNQVPYAVYNQDPGRASRDLLAGFTGSQAFKQVADLVSYSQIAPMIDSGEALMVVVVHPHFSRDLLSGRSGKLQVIVDGRNSNTALLLLGYMQNIVDTFSRQWSQDHGLGRLPADLNVRAWFNPNLTSRWFIVPGIVGLLSLIVALLVTALSVAREREAGTFDQLLVTPLTPLHILVGKALPGLLIGLGEMTAVIVAGVLWFRVPLLGSIPTLYLGGVLFLLSALGIGLMLSSLCSTQQQALLGTFMFMVPAIILSGFATPIANMPEPVQWLTYLNPMRYFLVVLRGVFLEGAGLELLWPQLWPMALIGLGSLLLAGWLFRSRLE